MKILRIEDLGASKPMKLATVGLTLRAMEKSCPSLFSGLDPSKPSRSLVPLISRMKKAALIDFDNDAISAADLARFHSVALVAGLSSALDERMKEMPDWKWFPEAESTFDPENLEWGAPPKEVARGDLPPEDDPRFGSW
jgi:hypothetical protein